MKNKKSDNKKIIESCKDIILPGSNGVMPIAGYYGPHRPFTRRGYTSPDYMEEKYFQMIADAGINLINYIEYTYQENPQVYHEALEMAEKYDIGLFVIDRSIKADMSDEEISACISKYCGYKSFAGLHIADEPSTEYFPRKLEGTDQTLSRRLLETESERSKRINSYDNMIGYTNILPLYFWMKSTPEDYERYVKEFIESFAPKVLSYDHYPFCLYYDGLGYEKAIPGYFKNFSIIYKYAKEYGLPIWSFIQAGGNWDKAFKEVDCYYPNQEQLLWLVNISLAYGSKGIQYYPLIQIYNVAIRPDRTLDPDRAGIIGPDGKPTRYFEYAKHANAQIAVVDEILLECENEGMIATGEAILPTNGLPEYFKEASYREMISVESEEKGVIIGCFDYHDKTVLYVVNYDWVEQQKVTLHFDGTYTYKLLALGCEEEQIGEECKLNLSAGAAMLIVVEKN